MSTGNGNKVVLAEDRYAPIPEVHGDILPAYVHGPFQLSMWVPSDIVGKIIGKGGSVIENIKIESKAGVVVQKPEESLWRLITITGGWASIVRAYNSLSELVEGEVDEVVFEFTINYRKMFFLYGEFAEPIIRRISARTNVRVYFPEPPPNHNYSSAEPFSLEGTFTNVTKAVALLEEQAVKYAEMMKERAAAAELKQKKEKELKEKREKGKDAKEKENDLDKAKLKVAPTIILERKIKPITSGPPAAEGAHSASENTAANKSKEHEVIDKSTAKIAHEKPAKDETKKAKETSKITTKPIVVPGVTVETTKEARKPASAATPAVSKSSSTPPIAPTLSTLAVPSSSSVNPPGTTESAVLKEPITSSTDEKFQKETTHISPGKVSRLIYVPFNIVGLLLSKKPRVKLSIMNQIQSNTRTIISKVSSRPETTSAISKKEEENGKTKKAKPEKRRRRISEDDSDDSDVQSEASADNSEDNYDSDSDSAKSEPVANAQNEPPVTFTIAGFSMDAVNAAYGYLERIINGERIKEVLDSMPRRPHEGKPEKSSATHREDKSTGKSSDKKSFARPVKTSVTSETAITEDAKEKDKKDVSASASTIVPAAPEEKSAANRPSKFGSKSKFTKGPPAVEVASASSPATIIAPGVSDTTAVASSAVKVPPVAPTLSDTITKSEGRGKEKEKEKVKLVENSRAEGWKNSTIEDKERTTTGKSEGGRGGGRGGGGRGRGENGRVPGGGRGRGRGPPAKGPPPV